MPTRLTNVLLQAFYDVRVILARLLGRLIGRPGLTRRPRHRRGGGYDREQRLRMLGGSSR